MNKYLFAYIFLFTLVSTSLAGDGLITVKSSYDVSTTLDRMEKIISDKGLTVFTRIDHAAGAKKAAISLRPTELLIFGNPKVGTPLMNCNQTAAIDLPQKALAWEDEKGQAWLSYNDPDYLANRHDLSGCEKVIEKIKMVLHKFSTFASGN